MRLLFCLSAFGVRNERKYSEREADADVNELQTRHELQTKRRDDLRQRMRKQYSLPAALEQLRQRRPASIDSSGYAEYAHALFASWYAHRHIEPLDSLAVSAKIENLYHALRREDSLVTTSFRVFLPLEPEGAVVRLTREGIRLSGRQSLAGEALDADELLIFAHEPGEDNPSSVVLVPAHSPDLRMEPEADAWSGVTAVFREQFVPWERVLVLRSPSEARLLLEHPALSALADYEWAARQTALVERATALAIELAERTGRHKELHIQGLLGELLQHVDTLKAFVHAAEISAYASASGVLLPAALPLAAAKRAGGEYYKRAVDALLRIVGASPAVAAGDDGPIGRMLRKLAFGEEAIGRAQHEQFAFGDPLRLAMALFRSYPQEPLRSRYESFWNERGVVHDGQN